MFHEALPIVVVVIPGAPFVVVLLVILPDIGRLLVLRSGCHLAEVEAGVHQPQGPLGDPHLQKELARKGLILGHHLAVHQGKRAWCLMEMALLRPALGRKFPWRFCASILLPYDSCLVEGLAKFT